MRMPTTGMRTMKMMGSQIITNAFVVVTLSLKIQAVGVVQNAEQKWRKDIFKLLTNVSPTTEVVER